MTFITFFNFERVTIFHRMPYLINDGISRTVNVMENDEESPIGFDKVTVIVEFKV